MSGRQMKYKVRGGTIDSGKKYEFKIAALLCSRCVRGEEDMRISSNVDKVGGFDDIILQQGKKTYMMQLKHKDSPTCLSRVDFFNEKSNFFLNKYIQDISKLKKSIENESDIIKHLDNNFDNIYFMLFTNREVKGCEFLKPVVDTNAFSILNTGGKLYNIEGEDYPSNMFLFSNQIHIKNIDKIIIEEIEQLEKDFKIKHNGHVGTKEIAEKFTQFVKDWAEGLLGGHYCLTKNDIICKLTELFLYPYKVKLIQKQFLFYKSKKKQIWNKLIQNEVITLVDYEEEIFEFLLEYLGCEVKKYCGEYNYWKDSFSKEAQNKFYQNYNGLKRDMLKIIGNNGIITLLDVYMCLWINKEVPILLEINDLEEYHDIVNIVKFSSHNYKVIIINKSVQKIFQGVEDTTKCFRTIKDLDQETRKEILNQEVKFQGRSSIKLEKLVNEDMLEHVNCKDIIKILLGRFSIGTNLKLLPQYFIPRSLSKIFIDVKVLDKLTNETFIIEETLEKDFSILKRNNIINSQIIVTSQKMCEKKIKTTKRPFHHLIIHDKNCLEWKASYGSVEKLKLFQINLINEQENNVRNKFDFSINIISAAPGMGKSVLMDYVALEVPMDTWVLKVDLNGHLEYYKNLTTNNALNHLEYFKKAISSTNNNELFEAIFKKLAKTKRVMVLLDGFDELPLSYKNEVKDIAKCLHQEGYKIWLTTRPHLNSYLEEELNTFSITLTPFTVNNQKEFLTNYFLTNMPLNTKPLIEMFVEKLLKAAKNNLNDQDAEFTGIPLQTKLLANVFKEDCSKYVLRNGDSNFNETFDLVYIYQEFINKKIQIFCKKFGSGVIDQFYLHKNDVVFFAIKLLFPKHKNICTYLDEKLVDYKNERKKLEVIQKEGIITFDNNFVVNFTHRTFAEFLIAEWLAENLNKSEIAQILAKERFICKDYNFLFNLYDRITSKNCPLRLAIINGDLDKALNVINTHGDKICEFDTAKRSILHILALHSTQFPLMNRWLWNGSPAKEFLASEQFNRDLTLKAIPKKLLHFEMDTLGYTPLEYALLNRSFAIAEDISANNNYYSLININIPLKYKRDYLGYCALLNYNSLFYDLLTYFVSREFLLNDIQSDEILKDYFCSLFKNHDNVEKILNYKFKIQSQTVLELLQSRYGIVYTGWNGKNYTNTNYAISFGNQEDFNYLTIDVNEQDVNGCTPLHYAALHKKSKIVRELLNLGSDINKQNINNDTALHLALRNNNPSSSESSKLTMVLSKIKDNPKNRIVKYLTRSNEANLNLINNNGCTPLHLAVAENNNNLISTFPATATEKIFNNTLHICNVNSVKCLLKNGANVKITDLQGKTVFHNAAQTGCVAILKELLRSSVKVEDINMLTSRHETPLFYAVFNNNAVDAIKLLLNKGACINELDCNGETPLFLATRSNKPEIVELLLSKNANIKIVNNDGKTVVDIAKRKKFNSIIELLSKNENNNLS